MSFSSCSFVVPSHVGRARLPASFLCSLTFLLPGLTELAFALVPVGRTAEKPVAGRARAQSWADTASCWFVVVWPSPAGQLWRYEMGLVWVSCLS